MAVNMLRKIFGRSDEQPETPFDPAAKRAQLSELSAALSALTRRMQEDGFPIDNPGWQGRVRDLAGSRAEADRIGTTDFGRQDLFDFTTTVRVLYRGDPPPEYAELAEENSRVVHALDALME